MTTGRVWVTSYPSPPAPGSLYWNPWTMSKGMDKEFSPSLLAGQGKHCKSFTWTAMVEDILGKVERARILLHKMASV